MVLLLLEAGFVYDALVERVRVGMLPRILSTSDDETIPNLQAKNQYHQNNV
jgi:hypothetical protein